VVKSKQNKNTRFILKGKPWDEFWRGFRVHAGRLFFQVSDELSGRRLI